MIDIIIPCYNAHATIDRCIGSILAQRVLPNIKVTLVNDGGKPYTEVVERYKSVLDIKEIRYEENGGPAKARNYGLLNTEEPLVMFMDSDDTLADPFSVVLLCNEMASDEHNVMIIGKFIEEISPLTVKEHVKDTSFMHGKMYKREFLAKYNILQNEGTRCNEDVGFNLLALMIARSEGYFVKILDHVVYYWLYNDKSIVRSDKVNYDHSTSFIGFVANLIYVYEELHKRGIDSNAILNEKITSMVRLYLLYNERTNGFPQFKRDNMRIVKDYYQKVYKHIEHLVTPELFDIAYDALPFTGDVKSNKKAIRKFIEGLK